MEKRRSGGEKVGKDRGKQGRKREMRLQYPWGTQSSSIVIVCATKSFWNPQCVSLHAESVHCVDRWGMPSFFLHGNCFKPAPFTVSYPFSGSQILKRGCLSYFQSQDNCVFHSFGLDSTAKGDTRWWADGGDGPIPIGRLGTAAGSAFTIIILTMFLSCHRKEQGQT